MAIFSIFFHAGGANPSAGIVPGLRLWHGGDGDALEYHARLHGPGLLREMAQVFSFRNLTHTHMYIYIYTYMYIYIMYIYICIRQHRFFDTAIDIDLYRIHTITCGKMQVYIYIYTYILQHDINK